jgi:hypothetical protein
MVNIHLLYYQLSQAALPVECVDINGRIDYSRALTPEEEATAAAVIAAHDPNGLLPEEIDRRDYAQQRAAALTELDAIIDGTSGLTAAQKTVFFARVLRGLIKITT